MSYLAIRICLFRNDDPLCCQHARAILGLNVITGTLPNAKCQADSYDVALMIHVIEHVSDPCQTLSELFRMLRPGGIVVVETPRYDTITFRLLGHRERSVGCEGHVYFFTTRTLERIAQMDSRYSDVLTWDDQ
jgi:2-polyprenyl-3-methyl-5-hydroxy-6-metoxy-1,4-benzoquinol methylase